MSDGSRRVALITGANKGIGLEIARLIAEAGICVLVGARDPERGKAAAQELASEGHDAIFLPIDLTNEASIARAASSIDGTYGRLDILVNNAGIVAACDGPPGSASLDAVRQVIETNFLGTLAVTQAMLPLLRKARAARIVNLSSSLASLAVNGDPSSPYYASRLIGYNASKAALNMLTVQLAEELRDTNILVNSVSPGFARTDLTGNRGRVSAAEAATAPARFALLGEEAEISGRFENIDGAIPW